MFAILNRALRTSTTRKSTDSLNTSKTMQARSTTTTLMTITMGKLQLCITDVSILIHSRVNMLLICTSRNSNNVLHTMTNWAKEYLKTMHITLPCRYSKTETWIFYLSNDASPIGFLVIPEYLASPRIMLTLHSHAKCFQLNKYNMVKIYKGIHPYFPRNFNWELRHS